MRNMTLDIREIIRNYINAHERVTDDRREEDTYLTQIKEIIQALYKDAKVKIQDGYITIGYFTIIEYKDIKPLLDLGLTNFHIDTHMQVETHYIKIPTYYNNLKIYIDIDQLKEVLGE